VRSRGKVGTLVDYEALNQYVLITIALFAVLLVIGLVYASFAQLIACISKKVHRKKRSRNRRETRGLRNAKRSF